MFYKPAPALDPEEAMRGTCETCGLCDVLALRPPGALASIPTRPARRRRLGAGPVRGLVELSLSGVLGPHLPGALPAAGQLTAGSVPACIRVTLVQVQEGGENPTFGQ